LLRKLIFYLANYLLLFIFIGNKNTTATPVPFYVRRQSSVDTHMQPFLSQMVAPRVPPVLEDNNEQDAL
jgi:hypothetical protein